MKSKGCLWGIGLLVFFGVIGVAMDSADTALIEATPSKIVATATAQPEPTATSECMAVSWSNEYAMVMNMWTEVHTLDSLDALIYKYDNLEMPYGCGEADRILDGIDTATRLGFGSHRTALMKGMGAGDVYFSEAQVHYQEATTLFEEWKGYFGE